MEKVPFSQLLQFLGETILVLGETMWAKLVMGETRYIHIGIISLSYSTFQFTAKDFQSSSSPVLTFHKTGTLA